MGYGKLRIFRFIFIAFLLFGAAGCLASSLSAKENSSSVNEKVVFVNERKIDRNLTTYDIYIVNSDGTDLKRLATNAINPVPSPDGKKIAFIPTRGEVFTLGISVMNADGTGRKDLIMKEKSKAMKADTFFLRWSPDSKKITYISIEDGQMMLSLFDIVAGKRIKLLEGLEEIPIISWSFNSKEMLIALLGKPTKFILIDIKSLEKINIPLDNLNISPDMIALLDNKQLLYYKDKALWVVNRDGTNNKKLGDVGEAMGYVVRPSIEVLAGKNIRLFTMDKSENGKVIFKLCEFNLDSKNLNIKAKSNIFGLFSPDGTKILTNEELDKYGNIRETDKLMVKDLKSEKVDMLLRPWDVSLLKPKISPLYFEPLNWIVTLGGNNDL